MTLRPSLALVFLLFSACSSDEPGPGAGGNKLRTEVGFCTEWARVACHPNVLDACESDEDGCNERQQTFCEDLVPSGYGSTHATDCILAVKTAYSDATLTAEESNVVHHLGGDCARLVDGGRVEGDTCTDSFECDTIHDYECVIKPGESTGTCQVPSVVGGGDRCDDPEIVCEEGYYCDGRNCVAVSLVDEPCTGDTMCEAGHTCVIATGETEGTCQPKLALRDPCTVDSECASNFCVDGATQTCREDVDLSLDTPFCADL